MFFILYQCYRALHCIPDSGMRPCITWIPPCHLCLKILQMSQIVFVDTNGFRFQLAIPMCGNAPLYVPCLPSGGHGCKLPDSIFVPPRRGHDFDSEVQENVKPINLFPIHVECKEPCMFLSMV